jgi:hypothetical protein
MRYKWQVLMQIDKWKLQLFTLCYVKRWEETPTNGSDTNPQHNGNYELRISGKINELSVWSVKLFREFGDC